MFPMPHPAAAEKMSMLMDGSFSTNSTRRGSASAWSTSHITSAASLSPGLGNPAASRPTPLTGSSSRRIRGGGRRHGPPKIADRFRATRVLRSRSVLRATPRPVCDIRSVPCGCSGRRYAPVPAATQLIVMRHQSRPFALAPTLIHCCPARQQAWVLRPSRLIWFDSPVVCKSNVFCFSGWSLASRPTVGVSMVQLRKFAMRQAKSACCSSPDGWARQGAGNQRATSVHDTRSSRPLTRAGHRTQPAVGTGHPPSGWPHP